MLDLMIMLILVTFLVLVVTVVVFVYISGISTSMEFTFSSNIPYLKNGATFYYRPYKGSYTAVGPLFTEAYSLTPKFCQCGLYYNDPDNEPPENCRAAIGVLLDDGSEEDISALEYNGFKKFHIPPIKEALYAPFPHISFLSVFIGIFKALPLLRKRFKDYECDKFTYIEVYDAETIHYIGIVRNIEDFLVEEYASKNEDTSDEMVHISKSDIEEMTDEKKKVE